MTALFLPGIFILSLALTGYLRRYTLARKILDIPNHRSSHRIPTPRGGGLSFVFCCLIAIPFLEFSGRLSFAFAFPLFFSGLFIAVLGLVDDYKSVSARWRLSGHFIASMVALSFMGGMPSILFFSWTIPSGLILNLTSIVYIVWLTNLYNFMDGIDGLAAVEAICVCLGGAFLFWLSATPVNAVLPLVLAFAVAGFLYWNFPPARIFMGDCGSAFLGFFIALMSIHAATVKPDYLWSWFILSGVFIVDSTATLLWRACAGDRLFEAHCSHAYQHASKYYGRHLPVTLAVFLINFFWLLPLAIAVGGNYISNISGLIIAYLPLALLACKFQAGKKVYSSNDDKNMLCKGKDPVKQP